MATFEKRNIDTADDTRAFPNGEMKLVNLEGVVFARATFQPGWRWTESLKPMMGTDSCEVHHNGYVAAGRLHLKMDDGTEDELGPGDVFVAKPGHDAWVVGDEPCVVFDFSSDVTRYAKQ